MKITIPSQQVDIPDPYEGASQYGVADADLLTPYLNGKALWDVMGTQTKDTEIPYSKLEAVA